MALCGEMGMKRMSDYLNKNSMVLVGMKSRGEEKGRRRRRGRKTNSVWHGSNR